MRIIVPFALGFAMAACGPTANTGGDDDGNGNGTGPDAADLGFIDANYGGNGNEFADAAPAAACTKMDILFVIDNSGSMAEEQTNLATNFPEFIRVLEEYMTTSGDLLDYRVAVTTTGRDLNYSIALGAPFPPLPFSEAGEDGALLMGAGCGMPRRWLERTDASVAGTFSCVADVGINGPSIEMPFHALELAFTDRLADGTNTGFLREDALLAVVILSDEDDCSRRDNNFEITGDQCYPEWPQNIPVAEAVQFFDDLKGDRGRWATAVIAGPGPGTCSSTFGEAFEARRLRNFVDMTGDNAIFRSICEGDLASALADALDTFEAACESFPPVE